MTKSTQVSFVRIIWLMVLILFLAAALRIISAGHFSVWTDEGWSTWAASNHNLSAILAIVASDRHPPLYFVALSGWWTVAGDSRIALRFLAIAAGIITVALTYRIGCDWFSPRSALYGALIAAVIPIAVYYSQEIRHYAWLMLFTLLMTWLFLRYLRQPRPGILIMYAICTALMLWTLYIGAAIIIIHAGIGLLAWHGTTRQKIMLIGAWLGAAILYLPWLAILSQQLGILSTGIDGFSTSLNGLLTVSQVLFSPQWALVGGAYVLGIWAIGSQPAHTGRWLAQITLVWCGSGLLGLFIIGNLRIGLLSARTLVFLTPYLAVIAGHGLGLLTRPTRRILTFMLVSSLIVAPGVLQPRLNYAAAAQAVAMDYMPGDLIVLENGWDDNAFRYELLLALGEPTEPNIIRTLPWVDNRDLNQPILPQVEPLLRTNQRVWIINWLQPSQMIPFLDSGGDGFIRVLNRQTSTGSQYQTLFADQMVRETLYERPHVEAQTSFSQFGDGLILRDAVLPIETSAGHQLQLDLWWSTMQPLTRDYSVSVFMIDDHGIVQSQSDQQPGSPTSQWALNTLKFDRHTIMLPSVLLPGTYRIGVDVYWYGDKQRLPIKILRSGLATTESYVIIGQMKIVR